LEYYELTITVYLKKDIALNRVGETLGQMLKSSMKFEKHLSELHASKGVKLYGYDYLYPRAVKGIYSQGHLYVFKLRTPIKETALTFMKTLDQHENDAIKVVAKQMKQKQFNLKTELYTSTPVVCTLGSRYWKKEEGIAIIQEKMEKNLVTKYNAFYGCLPEKQEGFLNYLEIKNDKPITIKYKSGSLVGNKFLVGFTADDVSLKMAYLAYSTSLLEKSSSLGTGFCI